jgi:hypothetical protein
VVALLVMLAEQVALAAVVRAQELLRLLELV